MVLIRETPFLMDAEPHSIFSCLLEQDKTLLGVDLHGGKLCSWNPDGELTQTQLTKKIEKLSYSHLHAHFFAISRFASGSIFLLGSRFQELERIRIQTKHSGIVAEDIWFDANAELLWLVYPEAIYRFSSNGDSLGVFMSAPAGTRYRALCTCGDLLFLAYQKGGCSYISSYTRQGAHLERMNLGGTYTVCNLQPVETGSGRSLRVFARKEPNYPYTLELELSPRPFPTLSVECFSDTPQLRTTCHICSPFCQ